MKGLKPTSLGSAPKLNILLREPARTTEKSNVKETIEDNSEFINKMREATIHDPRHAIAVPMAE